MRYGALVVVVAMGVSGAAKASSFGTQKSKLHLIENASYHGASPVDPLPSPIAPVKAVTEGSFLLLGLGLTLGGLVLGGAGFGVLYLCREGTTCHNNTTTIVGWVLAAPGIIPLVVGLAILYFGSGGGGRRGGLAPKEEAGQWALSFMPMNGGGLIGGAVRF